MKKFIPFLLMATSAFFFSMSIMSGINVIRGQTTIGDFFITMFVTNLLAVIFVITSGYLTLRDSKKFKLPSKKMCIFIVSFFVIFIIAILMTAISSAVDKVIIVGDFKKLVSTFLMVDISILGLGFFAGVFLTGAVNKNIISREKSVKVDSKRMTGNKYRYIFSFLIPVIGYILGAILLSKDDETEKITGKNCIILGVVSAVIGVIVWLVFVGSMF